ncbi:MAG: hypothetical protein HY300_04615 [Verrucomicrobia bacterium]|nr:hypothetical protein [Verrucomicrobiota bacterium]
MKASELESTPSRRMLAWRFLVRTLLIVWLGGFTFYTGVVIRVGHAMYPDRETIGFLTRDVTFWLNWIGLLSLALLAPNCRLDSRNAPRRLRCGLFASLGLITVALTALFLLHGAINGTLDVAAHRVVERARFHKLHEIYEAVATVQWAAALLHLWCLLAVWQRNGGRASAAPDQTC